MLALRNGQRMASLHYRSGNEKYKALAGSIIEGLPPQFQDNQIAQAFAELFLDKKYTIYNVREPEKQKIPRQNFIRTS